MRERSNYVTEVEMSRLQKAADGICKEVDRLRSVNADLYAALEQVQIDIKRAATNNVIWPDTQRQIEAALLKARGTEKDL